MALFYKMIKITKDTIKITKDKESVCLIIIFDNIQISILDINLAKINFHDIYRL